MDHNNQLPKKWVLVRGLIRSRYHWKSFSEQLKEQLGADSVECVELFGNGYLHDKTTPDNIEDAIKHFETQIDASSQPTGLIGISLGGMLAAKWAQLHSKKFTHLVLINSSSSLSPFYHRLSPAQYVNIVKNLVLNDPPALEEFILRITSNNEKIWKLHLKDNIEFLQNNPVKILNFIRQLKLSTQVNFNDSPGCQKLILTSKNDRLVNFNCSAAIARAWNCNIRYHEKAGHDLPLDDATWVIEQIRAEFK